MTENPDAGAVVLDASADPNPEAYEHLDDITEDEEAAGEVMYREVDDLDDDSNGID